MKSINKTTSRWVVIAASVMCLGKAVAQAPNTVTLHIGDQVPEFKYSKWIKGDKVSSFTGDDLYVIEFWATWCGPCKEAMPHLTKLQEKYKNKVTFIGVGVWERVAEGKPYESSLPMVEAFVKGNTKNMGYAVVADNNEQTMGNKWLKAAGELGIPSTFIVKNNKILWIGHPGLLDSLMPTILDGSYDMAAARAKRDKGIQAQSTAMAERMAIMNPIQEAIKQKNYAKALELIDIAEAEKPDYKTMLNFMRLNVLLSTDPAKAIEFVKEWQKERKGTASTVLGEVYLRNDLPKDIYIWVAKNFEAENLPTNAIILHAMAMCYAKGDDYKSAVIWEEKAVESAKQAIKESSKVINVTAETVAEYEKALEEYRKKS
jgi:thiol-disulfide isomerase/thioredoxin